MDVVRNIFDEINDKYYEELKKLSSRILRFRVVDEKEVTRDFFLEKIYDYLDAVNIKNSINPRKYEYVSIYMESLLSLIDNKVVKESLIKESLKKRKLFKIYKIHNANNLKWKNICGIFIKKHDKNKENCADIRKVYYLFILCS